jgi:hypothetical protein
LRRITAGNSSFAGTGMLGGLYRIDDDALDAANI